MKNKIAIALTVCLMILSFTTACAKKEKEEIRTEEAFVETEETQDTISGESAENVSIVTSQAEIILEEGETVSLSYSIEGIVDTGNYSLGYMSGDPNKVSVSTDGRVTGMGAGSTYVVAKHDNKEMCYWNIQVIPQASITSDTTDIEIYADNEYKLSYVTSGGNDTFTTIFTSSDDSVATVSKDGIVNGISAGSVTITAQYGKIAKCEWSVKVNPPNFLPDGEYVVGCNYVETGDRTITIHFDEEDFLGNPALWGQTVTLSVPEDCNLERCDGVDENDDLQVTKLTIDELEHVIGPGVTIIIKDGIVRSIVGSP